MAVVILNVSEDRGQTYGEGEQTYELRINHRVLNVFCHKFEDGLSKCLLRAAEAARVYELKEEQDGHRRTKDNS